MTASPSLTPKKFNPARLFGALFILAGLGFLLYGGFGLLDLYRQPVPMFDLETGLSPEKGMMWAKCLAGGSVTLMGVLMIIQGKTGGDQGKKSD